MWTLFGPGVICKWNSWSTEVNDDSSTFQLVFQKFLRVLFGIFCSLHSPFCDNISDLTALVFWKVTLAASIYFLRYFKRQLVIDKPEGFPICPSPTNLTKELIPPLLDTILASAYFWDCPGLHLFFFFLNHKLEVFEQPIYRLRIRDPINWIKRRTLRGNIWWAPQTPLPVPSLLSCLCDYLSPPTPFMKWRIDLIRLLVWRQQCSSCNRGPFSASWKWSGWWTEWSS